MRGNTGQIPIPSRAKDAWLKGRLAEVLNAPYTHLVFTLSHCLNGLYGAHRYFPEGGGRHDGTLGFAASACTVRIDTPGCTARERHCSGVQIGRSACN